MLLRILFVAALIAFSLGRQDLASAATSPPLCAEGSWPIRSSDGWTCTSKRPSDDRTEGSTFTTAKPETNAGGLGRSSGGFGGGFGGMSH